MLVGSRIKKVFTAVRFYKSEIKADSIMIDQCNKLSSLKLPRRPLKFESKFMKA